MIDATAPLHSDIERILIPRERIAERIDEMGAEIRRDLASLPSDTEIILVPILTGAIIFVADLIRRLPLKIRISVLSASSYAGRTTQPSGAPLLGGIPDDLTGAFVIVIDDILDSGSTIRRCRAEIEARGPRAVRTCVLLRKQRPAAASTPCEYVGFDVPDEWVVGYGLDYNGYYRNLPDLCVLRRTAF
jgi:hypoxanthine phosphoribosyltransferase